MATDVMTAAEWCSDAVCIQWCWCGDCEHDYRKRAKYVLGVLLATVIIILFAVWGVQYTRDYASFTRLDYTVQTYPPLRQHTCTTSDGSIVQCYDGMISGTYNYGGQTHSCVMIIATNVYLSSNAMTQLQQQYPIGSIPATWSATPTVDNTCTFSVDSHVILLGFAIGIACVFVLFVISQCVLWCREQQRIKLRQTVVRLSDIRISTRPAKSRSHRPPK